MVELFNIMLVYIKRYFIVIQNTLFKPLLKAGCDKGRSLTRKNAECKIWQAFSHEKR